MSKDKTDETAPPGFTPEEWAGVEAFIDRHTQPDGTVDVDGANDEVSGVFPNGDAYMHRKLQCHCGGPLDYIEERDEYICVGCLYTRPEEADALGVTYWRL